MRKYPTLLRAVSLFIVLQLCFQIFFPTISYALTSGPSQPEFSSFEPITATNMVDEFTGDFSYNLPLLEVPGPHGGSYPLSLSYHSGASPEEEASWVGFGWTLNAGAINRSVRGIPDDYKGESVINHNKTPTNWTATLGAGIFLEAFSKDKGMFTPSLNATYRYNNYRGFSLVKGAGLALGRGLVSMGYSVDQGEGSFSLNVSPMAILNKPVKAGENQSAATADREYKARDAFKGYFRSKASTTLQSLTSYNLGSKYGIFTYNQGSVTPAYTSAYQGASFNVSGTFNADPTALEVGVGFNLMGGFTYQRNQALTNLNAYGLMYSFFASKANIMDYHIEKDNPYDKQDEYIGIPFNDADQFVVSGEGIGGGFRLYTSRVGHFGPTETQSDMQIRQISAEAEAGLNWGGGVDIGVGKHSFGITDWKRDVTGSWFPNVEGTSEDEPAFFRFNNDLGGSWGERSKYNDSPVKHNVTAGLPAASIDYLVNSGLRGGRSSYIGFHTNKQIRDDATGKFITYSKRNWNFFVDRTQNLNLIGELSVVNENGFKYVYALPVYSKAEKNLNVGLPDKFNAGELENNFVAYKKKESVLKIGQEKPGQYAHSYLMTEILTPDYVDKTYNGVTGDDLGGYVRFGYYKLYGMNSEEGGWYHWRIPYNGVSYQRNALSDKKDDMGSLVSGDKEIYYLKTIETKTHVAIMHFSARQDGLGAADDETAMTKGAKASADDLRKLDKIELYALATMGEIVRDNYGNIAPPDASVKPVKTVHFKYADAGSELMRGAPNTTASSRGKLTLTQVYFEYNDISHAKLSPYRFEYKYPTVAYPHPSKYGNLTDFGAAVRTKGYWNDPAYCNTTAEDPENPSYSPFNVDAWGNYQPFGCRQYNLMRTWTDQSLIPNEDFDPAPWHLKRIILPSGGEIHVQYEQDDYQFVQDQYAHVMIPLLAGQPQSDRRIYIDLTKIGISSDPGNVKKELLKTLISNRYIGTNKKIYFRFLYKLKGGGSPDLNNCNSEYVTGYAKVSLVDYNATGFFIEFGDTRVPKNVCNDYVYANVIGRINESSDCNRSNGMVEDNENASDKSRAMAAVSAFFSATASALGGSFFSTTYCTEINNSLSYLRIPSVDAKKGGGTRVKRLLMYDNSIIDNAVLYGNEYTYTTVENEGEPSERIISSGVAANEPNREENILVEYLEKKRQNWTDRIVAGNDKEVAEGPIGESVYPGPSVGYSKVIITNIHSGTTNPGFTVTEYHTARDYPVKVQKSEITASAKLQFKLGIFGNKFVNKRTASQGFSIVLNNMHGQLKRKASYAGDYSAGINLDKSALVSEQVLEYFASGEDLPVINDVYGTVSYASLGREVDLTLAQRSITENSWDGNTEVDLTAGVFGLFVVPMFNLMGSLTKTEALLNTHATTKVVRYPAVVKKTTTYQDGIYHTDEYVAFSALNGKPVAVKSKDEFKGAYLNQSIPAGWKYDNFRQKASNENLTVTDGSGGVMINPTVNGRVPMTFTGSSACTRLTNLSIGDLLKLQGSFSLNYYHVESIDYGASIVWLVPSRHNSSVYPITSPSTVYVYTVLESGRNNQLNQSAGNIIFHDPVKDNIDPADLYDPLRYETNSFTTALDSGFAGAPVSFTLAGPYSGMNMSAYASYLPSCAASLTNATVRNLMYTKLTNSGSKTLVTVQFEVECSPGVWTTVSR